MRRKTFREGFTLVELSLSMVFVGILSLLIVFIIGNTVASYRRGITVGRVNTVGMEIVDDIRTAVQNASSAPVTNNCEAYYIENMALQNTCKNDGAFNFISIEKKATVTVNGTTLSNVPVFGAFCTGTYSYIWNSGYFESDEATVTGATPAYLIYKNDAGAVKTVKNSERDSSRPFRLLKVRDSERSVCVSVVRPYNTTNNTYAASYNLPATISSEFNISNGYGAVSEVPEDVILADSDNDLVLYSFDVARPAESTTQQNMFYSIAFILGTMNGGVNIKDTSKKCSAPNDYATENFDYCAINKFNFAVQANGE